MISLPLALAAFTVAFLLVAAPGRAAVGWLRRLGAKQNVSSDAPTAHAAKQGTPSLGGLLILASFTFVTLGAMLWTQSEQHRHVGDDYNLLPLLLLTLAFGVIGFLDDYLSAKRGKNLGLRAREKFAAQVLVAVGFAGWLASRAQPGLTTYIDAAPQSVLPPHAIELGWLYYPLAVLLIVGLSNGVNFTDGLDGLASGVTILICFALAGLAWTFHGEVSLFALILAGAIMGFLWWNAHPARMFMGDTGSLALGAGLAGAALLGKQEIGLIVASLVCWAELVSVIIQVVVFKWRRKTKGLEYAKAHRVFRRTPLHHHFEESGWPETHVAARFWMAGALCAGLALLWCRQ